jgi:hypothetical protein
MAYVLAQSNPAATTDTDLYTVPANTEAVVSTIAISEHAGIATTYRILLRDDGDAAADEHRLVYGAAIAGNDTVFITIGATLGPDDVVTVYAETGDVTFMLFAETRST